MMAACKENTEIVKLLLDHPNIDVNSVRLMHRFYMCGVCFKFGICCVIECFCVFLCGFCVVFAQGRYPSLVAACASSDDNIEVVKLLLAHPKIDVNAREEVQK